MHFHARKHLRLLCICSVTMLPTPCLGTTANSLRGVNFEQTQTSRKTISNHSSKPGILKLVNLVLKNEDGPENFHFHFLLGVQDLKYDTFFHSLGNKLAVLGHFSKKIASCYSNFLGLRFILFKQFPHLTFPEASLLFPIGTFQPKVNIQHFRIELTQKRCLLIVEADISENLRLI